MDGTYRLDGVFSEILDATFDEFLGWVIHTNCGVVEVADIGHWLISSHAITSGKAPFMYWPRVCRSLMHLLAYGRKWPLVNLNQVPSLSFQLLLILHRIFFQFRAFENTELASHFDTIHGWSAIWLQFISFGGLVDGKGWLWNLTLLNRLFAALTVCNMARPIPLSKEIDSDSAEDNKYQE